MSTYYYAICTKHEVVSRVLGGRSFPQRWWSNDGGELEDFLCAHGDCKPSPLIVSEHDERTCDYAELDSSTSEPASPGEPVGEPSTMPAAASLLPEEKT